MVNIWAIIYSSIFLINLMGEKIFMDHSTPDFNFFVGWFKSEALDPWATDHYWSMAY